MAQYVWGIGYLFLVERLPPDHELQLLLINTIRKVCLLLFFFLLHARGQSTEKLNAITRIYRRANLQIYCSHCIRLLNYLFTISHRPSPHCSSPNPFSVTPRTFILLSHSLSNLTEILHGLLFTVALFARAAIRQRTYQALVALHLSSSTFPRTPPQLYSQAQQSIPVPLAFPLLMSKVVKAVCRETDGSCLCVLFKLLKRLIHVSRVLPLSLSLFNKSVQY